MPMPEAQIRQSFVVLASNTGTTLDSVVSLVVGTAGTKVVYDHWEDGYEVDLNHPQQPSTLVWGDGSDSNGKPPGYPADPAGLAAGGVIALRNLVSLPRNAATILFDGRDRIGATKGIVVSRSAWATTPGSVLADATEVASTIDWGDEFVLPVGEDVIYPTPLTNSMFEKVSLFVQAAQNGTQITIDTDANGTPDVNATLNQGENHYLASGLRMGARVSSNKPVQVHLLTGDVGANYESRWFSIAPLDQWGGRYYSPVGTAADGDDTYVFLHNPAATPITVNHTTRLGTGSFSIPAKQTHRFLMPQESGASFLSDGDAPFFAVGAVGAEPTANNVHDWGFSLVPEANLTTAVVVGWGPGSSDLSQNGSPVWVTPVAATRVYVDLNGDRAGPLTDPAGNPYDLHHDLGALEVKRLYDPDKDQTGMRIYTLDGTLITAAWGQDPAVAGPGNPFLDVGTTVPAFPVPVIKKTSQLAVDTAPPGPSIGDTLEYTITMDNKGLVALGNVLVLDGLPPQLAYVADSTTRDGSPIADDPGPATAFPLDEAGIVIPILPRGSSTTVHYHATITAAGSILNTALTSYEGVTSNNTVNVPGGSSPCAIDFTDAATNPVATYLPGATAHVRLDDPDANTNPAAVETVTVLVQNPATGDFESLTLTEAAADSGTFLDLTGLPVSPIAGLSPQDGTLHALPGHTLTVAHTDPLHGETCTDSVSVAGAPAATKQLYLSNDGTGSPDQDLDRIDPVATGDATTLLTNLPAPGTATIAVDAVSTGSAFEPATGFSFNHTTGTGADRLLLVGISFEDDNTAGLAINSVSYAGQPLTFVGRRQSTQEVGCEIWRLTNPPSGTASVQVSVSGAGSGTGDSVYAGALTLTGVHQAAPLGTLTSADGTGTTASLTTASAAGELVFDVLALDDARSATAAAGQTQQWSGITETANTDGVRAAASTKPGAPSVTTTWTVGSDAWALCAVPVKPAATTATLTFTQSQAMAGPFEMPAGGMVTARTFLEVTNGTLPANPALTATLDNGTANFITLANPALTPLNSAPATITADPTSTSNSANTSSLSFAHTVGSGANRLLMVTVQVGATTASGNPPTVTGVTYGGAAMTLVGSRVSGGGGSSDDVIAYIYRMLAPPAGAANVVVTLGAAGSIAAGATSFAGVNQITPLGTHAANSGTGASATVDVASAPGELVIGTAGWDEGPSITLPAGSGQTTLWTANAVGTVLSGSASTEPGAATVTHSYSAAGSTQDWAILAVPLKPATVATLYQLDWSGALAAATTVTPGDRIGLTLSNNQTAAGLRLLSDSATYPSHVALPATTVIHVDSVAVYDAPYPAGNPVTTPNNGQVLHVRAVVGDPFGSHDITSLPLVIDGPGASADLATTLTDADVVADDGHLKTYQFSWATTTVAGNYTITATAREGFENAITHSRSTQVNLSPLDLGTPSVTEFTTGPDGPHTLTYNPNETVCVRIRDLDQNQNPAAVETIPAVITSSSGDSEPVILTETGPDTGVFIFCIPASATNPGATGDATLHAPTGSLLTVNYVDPNDPNDTGSDTATVPAPAGTPALAVTKTLIAPADGQCIVGDPTTWRIRVTNTGGTTLANVSLTDTFPAANLAFLTASPAPDSAAAGTLTWTNLGPLAPGQSAEVLVDFTALASAAPAVNTTLADAGGGTTATGQAGVTITRPELTVTKTLVSPLPGPAAIGDDVVFQITVHNTGDTAIATLPLEDSFSASSFEFVSASIPPDGTGAGSLLWNDLSGPATLAPGNHAAVTVTMRVTGAADPANNHATVNYAVDDQSDPVPPAADTAGLETLAASIRGRVLDDAGPTGFDLADLPLPGVTVQLLTDPNGDGNPADGTLVALTTTAADGSYEFPNLPLGNYLVTAIDLLGWASVADTAGPNDHRIPVAVTTLTDHPGNDFLDDLINPADYATITGQVREDLDADGDLADPDPGIASVTIDLYTDPDGDGDPADGVLFASTPTSGGGSYTFANVPPGSYVLVESDPAGFASTGDADLPNDNRIAVTLTAGATSAGNDFLDTANLAALGTLGDRIWSDSDFDGLYEPAAGEPGLDGVLVELYRAGDTPGVNPPFLATVTSGGGIYQFAALPAGDYFIHLSAANFAPGAALANHSLSTNPTDPADNGEDHDDNGIQTAPGDPVTSPTITVAPGETDTTLDFGFVPDSSRGSIAGSVFVDVEFNGSIDIALDGVQITLRDAGGNPLATTTTSNGNYRFADLPPGSYSVSQSQPAGYLSVSDADGGDPDLIGDPTPIVLAAGAAITGRDFLERPLACPNTWAGWQQKWTLPTAGQTGPAENPDLDTYSNLIEYAFCMPPDAGIFSPFCVGLSTTVPNAIDGIFRRTAGGATDVVYQLDFIADLALSPAGWTTLTLDPADLVVTVNPFGTETVRIPDLETLTGLTSGAGFVRMRVLLDADGDSTPEAADVTEVRGWVETPLAINCQTFSTPFFACPVFSGTISAVAGNLIELAPSTSWHSLADHLNPGTAYYLEVVAGDHEGQRFDIASPGTSTLTLAVDADPCDGLPPHNTLAGPPPATLTGDTVVVRAHRTLGELFPIGPGAFQPTGSLSTADKIMFNHAGNWSACWAYDDGANPPRWVLAGDPGYADQGSRVVPPGEGMFIYCRQATINYLAHGGVRANDFAQPLRTGINFAGGGYPLDQSPVSRALTLSNGFFGGRDPARADRLHLWNADTNTPGNGYTTHYLLNASNGPLSFQYWTQQGDVTLPDQNHLPLLLRDRSAFHILDADHPSHLVPAPWTP